MACSINLKLEKTAALRSVEAYCGTNTTLLKQIVDRVSAGVNSEGIHVPSESFSNWYKDKYQKDVDFNGDNPNEIRDAIIEFYKERVPSAKDGAKLTKAAKNVAAYGYTSAEARTDGQKVVTGILLNQHITKVIKLDPESDEGKKDRLRRSRYLAFQIAFESKLPKEEKASLLNAINKASSVKAIKEHLQIHSLNAGFNIYGKNVEYYKQQVKDILKEEVISRIALQTGEDRDVIASNLFKTITDEKGKSRKVVNKEYIDAALGKDYALLQDKNIAATFLEVYHNTKDYFEELSWNNKLDFLRNERTNEDNDENELKAVNAVEGDEGEGNIDDEVEFNDDTDLSISMYDHTGTYTSAMLHVNKDIKAFLNSIPLLKSNQKINGNYDYDLDNALGMQTTMDASQCATVIYHYANRTSNEAFIQSIRDIAAEMPGFGGFEILADIIASDENIAFAFKSVFSKPLITKTQVVTENGIRSLNVSNKKSNRLDAFRQELFNCLRSSIPKQDYFYNTELGKKARLYLTDTNAKIIRNDKEGELAKRAINAVYQLLKHYYTNLDDYSIANFVYKHKRDDGVIDVVDNLTLLLNQAAACIKASEKSLAKYDEMLAEDRKVTKENNELAEQKVQLSSAGFRTDNLPDPQDVSKIYAKDYMVEEQTNAAIELSDLLVDYVLIKTENNSINPLGNQSSDVINSSFITGINEILKDKAILKEFGKFKLQSKQYKFSNILLEHIDEDGTLIRGIFREVNGGFELTDYGQELLSVSLYNGARNYDEDKGITYPLHSKGDYLASLFAAFHNVERENKTDKRKRAINYAGYFMRTPADATNNFEVTAPKYSAADLFVVTNQAEVDARIKSIKTTMVEKGFFNDKDKNVKNTSAVSTREITSMINHITRESSDIVLPEWVTRGLEEGEVYTIKFQYAPDGAKNNENIYLMKGIYKDGMLMGSTFEGIYTNSLSKDVSNELTAALRSKLDREGFITRTINSKNILVKQLKNILRQEILDAAIAIDKFFVTKNGLVCRYDKDTAARLKEQGIEVNEGDIVWKNGISHNGREVDGAYDNYHHKKGVIVKGTTGNEKLVGNVFHSDRFVVYDEDLNEVKNYGEEIMQELYNPLYGGVNGNYIQTVTNDNGEIIDVNITEEQDAIINKYLEEYINRLVSDASTRLFEFEDVLGSKNLSTENIAEFMLNYQIMYNNFNELFEGDSKFYKSPQDFLKRAKEVQGSGVPYGIANFLNAFKSEKSVIASRLNSTVFADKDFHVTQYDKFTGVTVVNTITQNEDTLKTLVNTLVKTGVNKEQAQKLIDGFRNTKVNDAQSYISFKEWIRRVTARGQLNKYKPLINKVLRGEELNGLELSEFIQVQKNFYYDQYYDSASGIFAPRQIKNAEFVLVPQLIKGTELEVVAQLMDKYDIDQLNTEETSKAGKTNILSIFDAKTGRVHQDIIDEVNRKGLSKFGKHMNEVGRAKQLYSYEFLYTQQETPQHLNTLNKAGIQIMKKILDNIDPSNKELYQYKKDFINAYVENIKESARELFTELGLHLDNNGVPKIRYNDRGEIVLDGLKYSVFYEKLKSELFRLGYDSNMIDYVTLDTTTADENGNVTIMPNFMSMVGQKLESIAQSVFNRAITRQKLPGFHAAQITNVGFSAYGDKVTYSNELRYHTNKNGGYEDYIEIMLPASSFNFKRRNEDGTLKPKGRIEEDGKPTPGSLLEELYNANLQDVIGYRIPTEGKQSVAKMRVVGFIDDGFGSTIVVPNEWVAQTGSDFDIDSVYGIQHSTFIDKEGKIQKHTTSITDPVKMSREERTNVIVDSMLKILSHPSSLEEILSRSNFEDISHEPEGDDRGGAIQQIAPPTFMNRRKGRSTYNVLDQADYQEDTMSGAKLKGFSVTRDNFCSICNTVKPIIDDSKAVYVTYSYDVISYKDAVNRFGEDNVTNVPSKNQVIIKHNRIGWTLDNKNVVGKILTAYSSQTTAHILDAVKEGSVPNVNDFTFGVYKSFPDLGIDYKTAVAFMMQNGVSRIIKEYNKNRSIYSSDNSKPVNQAIRQIAKELKIEIREWAPVREILKEINKKHKDDIVRVLGITELKLYDNVFKPLDVNDLKKHIDSPVEDIDGLIYDLGIVLQYNNLKTLADEIGSLARVCNPDKFGAKQSIFATNKVFEDINSMCEKYNIEEFELKKEGVRYILNNVLTAANVSINPESPIDDLWEAIEALDEVSTRFSELGYDYDWVSTYFAEPKKPIIRVGDKHFLEAIYPGITNGIEEYMKSDNTGSTYDIINTFMKYSTAPSIIINRLLFKTQKESFREYVGGLEQYLSNGAKLKEDQYKNFEKYLIGSLYNVCDRLVMPITYNKEANTHVFVSPIPNGVSEDELSDYVEQAKEEERARIFGYRTTPEPTMVIKLDRKTRIPINPDKQTKQVDVSSFEFYSGAATGSDTEWANIAKQNGIKVKDYVVADYNRLSPEWKTRIDKEYREVVNLLGRRVLDINSYPGALVRRDMMQADKADSIFAIGDVGSNGYINGGTAYATTRGIILGKPVYLFDQKDDIWKEWDYSTNSFVITTEPNLTPNAAVIGTRQLQDNGRKAISSIISKLVAEPKAAEEIEEVVDFAIKDVARPTQTDINNFARLTPAQKVDFIQQNFRDAGIFSNLIVNLFNVRDISGKKAGAQTIEFVEDTISKEDAYIQFEEAFTNRNPLISLAAYDLVKYAFIVEGYKMSKRGISRIIPNSILYNDFDSNGTGVVSELNGIFNTFDQYSDNEDFYIDYVRSHYKQLNIPFKRVSKINKTTYELIPANGIIFIPYLEENQPLLDKYKITYKRGDENTVRMNHFVRLKFGDKDETLYKINIVSGGYMLYPLNPLEENEHGAFSSNSANWKYPSKSYYESIVRDSYSMQALDNKAILVLASNYNADDYKRKVNAQTQKLQGSIDFDMENPAPNDVTMVDHIKTKAQEFYGNTVHRNETLFMVDRGLQEHIRRSGKNAGLYQVLKIKHSFNNNDIEEQIPVDIYKVKMGVLIKSIQPYLGVNSNKEIAPEHFKYTDIINELRSLGVTNVVKKKEDDTYDVVLPVYAIEPRKESEPKGSPTTSGLKMSRVVEGRNAEPIDVAGDIFKTVTRTIGANKIDEDTTKIRQYWRDKSITKDKNSIENNLFTILRSGSEYITNRVKAITDKLNYFVEDPDTGSYLAVNSSKVMDMIYKNPKLRNELLYTLEEAEAIVKTNMAISELDIKAQDSNLQKYLNIIKSKLQELQNSNIINEAFNMFANVHLKDLSTDPLIRRDLINVLNGFHSVSYLESWLGDLQETPNSLLQILSKRVTSDLFAKQKLAQQLARDFGKKIEELKKEAAKHGLKIDWKNIVDKDGRFVQNFISKLVDDLEELQDKCIKTRDAYNNGEGTFRDFLEATFEYDKWKLAHVNREIDDEYYRRRLELEDKMLHGTNPTKEQIMLGADPEGTTGFPDIFVKYKELELQRREIHSHAVNGYLDPYYLDELNRITEEINNLIEDSYVNPITGQVEHFRQEYDDYNNPLTGTEEERKLKIIYSRPSQQALKDYLSEMEELNKEVFQRDAEFGFDEELTKNLNIISVREKRDANGNITVPMSELMEDPVYVAAKEWIAHSAKFVISDEGRSELNTAFSVLRKAGSRIKLKRAVETHNAKDELGTIDATKFTDEEIKEIRDEQIVDQNYHDSNVWSDRTLIKNASPSTVIYKPEFYAGLKTTGVNNKDWYDKVKEINDILEKYWDNEHKQVRLDWIPDTEEGRATLRTLGTLYQELYAIKKKNGVTKEEIAAIVKFREDNVDTQLTEEEQNLFNAQKTIAYNKPGKEQSKYAVAWNQCAYLFVDDGNGGSKRIINPYLFGSLHPKKEVEDTWIDKDKTAAINLINSTYVATPTEYYYRKIAEVSKQGKDAFNKWYYENHIWNPSTREYEPIRCWVKYTYRDTSHDSGNWMPRWENTRSTVREDWKNSKYIPGVGHAMNYKTGTGYDNPELNNQNEYEKQLKTYIQDLLYSLVHTDSGLRYLNKGYLPSQHKADSTTAKTVGKELLKALGWTTYHNGKERFTEDVGYDTDRTIQMPMLELLDTYKAEEEIKKPVKEEGESDEDFAKREAEYKKQLKASTQKYHREALNDNWQEVIKDFIIQASHFNAIQDNKYMLYFGKRMVDKIETYVSKYGGISDFKVDMMNSTDTNPEYITKKEKYLSAQYENWVRRIIFDEWKEARNHLTKWASRLQSLTSAQYMMLNIRGGIANVTLGSTQILAEAFAKEYIGTKALAKGMGLWGSSIISQFAKRDDADSISLADAIIKWFNVVDYDENTGKCVIVENPTMKGFKKFNRAMYSTQTIGENYMQNSVLFGMLYDHRVFKELDPKTNKFTVKFKNLTEYTREKDIEALKSILTTEQLTELDKMIEDAKADANKLKDYAWYQKDIVSEFLEYHVTDNNKRKEYIKKRDSLIKQAEDEFKQSPTLMDQLELGKDGYMQIKVDSLLGKSEFNTTDENNSISDALQLLADFRGRVISVNKKIHGVYDKLGQAQLEKKWYGSLVMQYHKHIYPGMMKRWRVKGMYNEQRGTIEKGSYISLIQFLSTPIKKYKHTKSLSNGEMTALESLKNIFKEILDFCLHYRMHRNLLSEYDRANLRRNWGDICGVLSAICLAMALRAIDDDDKEDSIAYNLMLYEADRLASESFQFNPFGFVSEAKKLWSTPIAAQSGIEDVISTMGFISDWLFDEDFDPTYQSGRFAGQNKFVVRLKRRIPIYRGINTGLFEIGESNHYYKMGQNMLNSKLVENMMEWVDEDDYED